MHVIIPYAFGPAEPCSAALRSCKLPNLCRLLERMQAEPADAPEPLSLSMPHERALARAVGLPLTDGLIPWAAYRALQHPTGQAGPGHWAFVSLCHWQVHSHHIALAQWPIQDLSETDDQALRQAMQPYFAQDGITLHPDQAGRWLAQGDALAALPTANPERVVGRDVRPWMPDSGQARALRRLQNEMQMLLYTHPVNDQRQAQGLRTINSFWLHGTGELNALPAAPSEPPEVLAGLEQSALAQDWPAWAQAWCALDAGPLQAISQRLKAGHEVRLTLCGERLAQHWRRAPASIWRSALRTLRQGLGPTDASAALSHL